MSTTGSDDPVQRQDATLLKPRDELMRRNFPINLSLVSYALHSTCLSRCETKSYGHGRLKPRLPRR